MLKKTFYLILSVIVLQSCNFNSTGTRNNKNIERRKKEEIKALNDKLVKSIVKNDVASMQTLLSDSLRDHVDINKLITEFRNFKMENYRILDEYNVLNAEAGVTTKITSDKMGDSDYEVTYPAFNKETYVSLLLNADQDNELLAMVIYGKYGEEWKINMIQLGQYRLLGKTAPDYLQLSKNSYDKSYLMNAVNYIDLSKQLLRPLNDFFKFKKQDEIETFHKKVMSEVNAKYPLPLTLDNIETKPKIYKMVPQVTREGFFPMFYYLSVININDETALKSENEKVKQEVDRIFSGIKLDKKYIFYWVSNELPDKGKVVEQYGFVDSLEVKPNL